MSAVLDAALRTVQPRRPRTRRRSARVAEVASAMVAAPIRYAVRPVTATDVVRRTCGSCPGGSRCCGSYTALCCTLPGGDNFGCPPNTFIGGWWQCNYGGTDLCGTTNMRYYLDCSIDPGHSCPGGCHCGRQQLLELQDLLCRVPLRELQHGHRRDHADPMPARHVRDPVPDRLPRLQLLGARSTSTTCSHNAGCL